MFFVRLAGIARQQGGDLISEPGRSIDWSVAGAGGFTADDAGPSMGAGPR